MYYLPFHGFHLHLDALRKCPACLMGVRTPDARRQPRRSHSARDAVLYRREGVKMPRALSSLFLYVLKPP